MHPQEKARDSGRKPGKTRRHRPGSGTGARSRPGAGTRTKEPGLIGQELAEKPAIRARAREEGYSCDIRLAADGTEFPLHAPSARNAKENGAGGQGNGRGPRRPRASARGRLFLPFPPRGGQDASRYMRPPRATRRERGRSGQGNGRNPADRASARGKPFPPFPPRGGRDKFQPHAPSARNARENGAGGQRNGRNNAKPSGYTRRHGDYINTSSHNE